MTQFAKREVAHRLFATEFNASRAVIEGQGEKDPTYLVSPTGAKVNRVHVVGVCTDIETVGESGDLYKARISDPTGNFTVYAGQYQPEAAATLSELQVPAYVSITGKARTYEPEPGSLFISIRPEHVQVVDEHTRDRWVLETAKRTNERLQASKTLRDEPELDQAGLQAAGLQENLAEGVSLSKEHYGLLDMAPYSEAASSAVNFLVTGEEMPVHVVAPEPNTQAAPTWKPEVKEENPEDDAFDDAVLAVVKKLENDDGARWDDIVGEAGGTSDAVEEALNRLMDKGLVYEPTLGVLKTT